MKKRLVFLLPIALSLAGCSFDYERGILLSDAEMRLEEISSLSATKERIGIGSKKETRRSDGTKLSSLSFLRYRGSATNYAYDVYERSSLNEQAEVTSYYHVEGNEDALLSIDDVLSKEEENPSDEEREYYRSLGTSFPNQYKTMTDGFSSVASLLLKSLSADTPNSLTSFGARSSGAGSLDLYFEGTSFSLSFLSAYGGYEDEAYSSMHLLYEENNLVEATLSFDTAKEEKEGTLSERGSWVLSFDTW